VAPFAIFTSVFTTALPPSSTRRAPPVFFLSFQLQPFPSVLAHRTRRDSTSGCMLHTAAVKARGRYQFMSQAEQPQGPAKIKRINRRMLVVAAPCSAGDSDDEAVFSPTIPASAWLRTTTTQYAGRHHSRVPRAASGLKGARIGGSLGRPAASTAKSLRSTRLRHGNAQASSGDAATFSAETTDKSSWENGIDVATSHSNVGARHSQRILSRIFPQQSRCSLTLAVYRAVIVDGLNRLSAPSPANILPPRKL